jgi:hypothetical protein
MYSTYPDSRPICHNCQRIGHKSDNCPQSNPSSSPSSSSSSNNSAGLRCFNCQEISHKRENCPLNTNSSTHAPAAIEEKSNADHECVVCCDAQRDCVFEGCPHFVVCMGCAQEISNCPMCRAEIKSCKN